MIGCSQKEDSTASSNTPPASSSTTTSGIADQPPAPPPDAPAASQGISPLGSGGDNSTPPPLKKDLKTVALPSGLKYVDVVVGKGKQPQDGQAVTVDYTGWTEGGSKFDSSVDRGQPFSFHLGQHQVIKGWDIGVATMKEGGKRRLIIPPDLGYGASGQGPIPPNATLIFDVELHKVE
jgi:peptidylprolyl isomerase